MKFFTITLLFISLASASKAEMLCHFDQVCDENNDCRAIDWDMGVRELDDATIFKVEGGDIYAAKPVRSDEDFIGLASFPTGLWELLNVHVSGHATLVHGGGLTTSFHSGTCDEVSE